MAGKYINQVVSLKFLEMRVYLDQSLIWTQHMNHNHIRKIYKICLLLQYSTSSNLISF